jgi:uncharacterized membrane protein YjfL (UPF0719 family)
MLDFVRAAVAIGAYVLLLLGASLAARIVDKRRKPPTIRAFPRPLPAGAAAWDDTGLGAGVAVTVNGRNVALDLARAGRGLGAAPLAVAIAIECTDLDERSLATTAAYAMAGLVGWVLAATLCSRALLGRALGTELARGNLAAGVAVAAGTIGTGLVASRAFAGTDVAGLWLSLGFFVLGIVSLLIATILFRALTTYDDAAQVEGGNLAAAISYAGLLIAVALLIAAALAGEAESMRSALIGYAKALAFLLALPVLRQLVLPWLLFGRAPRLRGGPLDDAIANDHAVGIAALEASAYIAAALLIGAFGHEVHD